MSNSCYSGQPLFVTFQSPVKPVSKSVLWLSFHINYVQQISSALFVLIRLQTMAQQLQTRSHHSDLQSILEHWMLTIQKTVPSSTVSDHTPKDRLKITFFASKKPPHLKCLNHHNFGSLFRQFEVWVGVQNYNSSFTWNLETLPKLSRQLFEAHSRRPLKSTQAAWRKISRGCFCFLSPILHSLKLKISIQLKQFRYPIVTEHPVGTVHHLPFSPCLEVSSTRLVLIHTSSSSHMKLLSLTTSLLLQE